MKSNREIDEILHPPLLKDWWPKNYRSITLQVITAKVYNAILLNRTQTETEKIVGKNQTALWEIFPQLPRLL